jgi:hypothetical protein
MRSNLKTFDTIWLYKSWTIFWWFFGRGVSTAGYRYRTPAVTAVTAVYRAVPSGKKKPCLGPTGTVGTRAQHPPTKPAFGNCKCCARSNAQRGTSPAGLHLRNNALLFHSTTSPQGSFRIQEVLQPVHRAHSEYRKLGTSAWWSPSEMSAFKSQNRVLLASGGGGGHPLQTSRMYNSLLENWLNTSGLCGIFYVKACIQV